MSPEEQTFVANWIGLHKQPMTTDLFTTANLRIKIPHTPNFMISAAKEDMAKERAFPIADFDDTQLQRIGEAWTQNLIATARLRRGRGPMTSTGPGCAGSSL